MHRQGGSCYNIQNTDAKEVSLLMKRFLALLAAFVLMLGCAQAASTAPIASYKLPKGAQAVHLWDSGAWEIPAGLEGMYTLMQTAEMFGDVYLVRMPNGRAIVSVSVMKPDQHHTAAEMLALWPQIAQNIAKEGVSVDASESCATVETLFGFDALHIQTTITLGEWGSGMVLNAEGIAFPRGDELLEVWAVSPDASTYAADDPAAKELAADAEAMDAFVQSLSFTNLDAMAVDGVPYVDPEGRFGLVIPVGSTVLTAQSTQEEIAQVREKYLAVHEAGADKLFDEYMTDMITMNVTVIFAENYHVVAEIFAAQEEEFRDVTDEQLAALAQPIQQNLSEKFDVVLPLNVDDRALISGHKHAWLNYWMRSGDADVQLDVLAAVLEDAWLYEVDLYTHNGNQEQRMLWHSFITQTLRYTPLVNALD